MTFTTAAFDRISSWRFEAFPYGGAPKGAASFLVQHGALAPSRHNTTALDVTVQAQILRLLLELRQSTGMTLLLITHDMGIVAQLADSVAVMYSGSLVECSDVASLFKAAQHPYSQALLEAVPSIHDGQTILRAI